MTKEILTKAMGLQRDIETLEFFIKNLKISCPSIHGLQLCEEARNALLGIYKGKLAKLKHEFENL